MTSFIDIRAETEAWSFYNYFLYLLFETMKTHCTSPLLQHSHRAALTSHALQSWGMEYLELRREREFEVVTREFKVERELRREGKFRGEKKFRREREFEHVSSSTRWDWNYYLFDCVVTEFEVEVEFRKELEVEGMRTKWWHDPRVEMVRPGKICHQGGSLDGRKPREEGGDRIQDECWMQITGSGQDQL